MAKSSENLNEVRKKMAKTHELISVSYHEAGHTVYGLLKFFKIDPVYIFENSYKKRIWGLTHYESIRSLNDFQDQNLLDYLINSEICMSYAGLAAEKKHFKNSSGSDKFPMVLKMGSEEDTMEAAKLIKQFNLSPPGKKRYIFKKKLIKETLKELEDNWDAITIIAHSLFKGQKLNFNDLKDLLIKKSQNKEFWKEQFKKINYIFDNYQTLDEKTIKTIIAV